MTTTGKPSRPNGPNVQEPGLAEALAAYNLLLDNLLTARKYFAGERIEHQGVRVWGDIVERAAERERAADDTRQGHARE